MHADQPHHHVFHADHARPIARLGVLHGAFGSGRNWMGVMRPVVEARHDYAAVLVDLRGHGRSTDLPGEPTFDRTAADLYALGRFDAVLGHSFGGKVAMQYAQSKPPGLRQVWVIDSTPAVREPAGEAWTMLHHLRALPDAFDTRAEAVAGLAERGLSEPIAQWMAMNLHNDGGRFTWRIDLDAIEHLLMGFYQADLWPLIDAPPEGVEVHLVKATRSSLLTDAACERIAAAKSVHGRVHLHHVEGGHWLNVDNPQALADLLIEHLPR
ncbi:MAG: alpha/beta fold hydrolase [Planctomycetes bacterium]|nr:alpha/beta fold hydrolase [Planctomycetota bacterium]